MLELLSLFAVFALVGLFFYGIWKISMYLVRVIWPSKPIAAPPTNPLIDAHLQDEHNKKTYEEYLEWVRRKGDSPIFNFKSAQDLAKQKQEKKIKNLFK